MQLVLVMILHILVSVSLIILVLLQRGRGSDMGAAFGSGASSTMFGSQGTTPFMVKLIGALAVVFFCTSLILSYMVSTVKTTPSDLIDLSEPTTSAPAHSVPSTDIANPNKPLQDNS